MELVVVEVPLILPDSWPSIFSEAKLPAQSHLSFVDFSVAVLGLAFTIREIQLPLPLVGVSFRAGVAPEPISLVVRKGANIHGSVWVLILALAMASPVLKLSLIDCGRIEVKTAFAVRSSVLQASCVRPLVSQSMILELLIGPNLVSDCPG